MTSKNLKPLKLPDGTHAKLSASSAHRWAVCTASVELSEGLPNKSSFPAAEGTVAHFVGSEALMGSDPGQFLGVDVECDGFTITVDEAMLEAVKTYTDHVKSIAGLEKGARVEVECDLTPALLKLDPDFGGMADAIVYLLKAKHLYVIDYKHGAGVWVNAEDNPQLKYYALGALLQSGLPASQVTCTVVQPRCMAGTDAEAIRSWTFDTLDLLDFAAELRAKAAEARSPDAVFVTGEHCGFCPAKVNCPELRRHQEMVMAEDFNPMTGKELSPEKIAEALDVFPLLEARIKQVRELAYEMAMKGHPPPGHKLVDKRAMRSWKDPEAAETWATGILGDDAYQPKKLKTPPQLEKSLSKELKADMASNFVKKESSGKTLVPDSDSRPAVEALSADDFEDLN